MFTRTALTLLAIATTATTAHAQTNEVCQALNSIIETVPLRFKPILGKGIGKGRTAGLVVLPYATSCYVEKNSYNYTCEFLMKDGSGLEMARRYMLNVQQCRPSLQFAPPIPGDPNVQQLDEAGVRVWSSPFVNKFYINVIIH